MVGGIKLTIVGEGGIDTAGGRGASRRAGRLAEDGQVTTRMVGRIAEEVAPAGVHLDVEVHQIVDLPASARIKAEEIALLLIRPRFQEELGVGEGATGDDAIRVNLQIFRDQRLRTGAGAHAPVDVTAIEIVEGAAENAIKIEMQILGGTPFQAEDAIVAVAAALLVHGAAQPRHQSVGNLRGGKAGIEVLEFGGVDGLAGDKPAGGDAGGNRGRNCPGVAANGIASVTGAALRGRQRTRRHPAGIAVFPAFGEDLAMHTGNAQQDAEFVAPSVARDQRPALTQRAGIAVIAALRFVGDVEAFILVVEGPGAAQIDHAGRAAFEQIGIHRLVHRQLGEQFGRQHIQVDFAVIVGLIGRAGGGDGDGGAIERYPGEIRAQAADRDIQAFAVDFAADGDARDAIQRFGDVGVREFADIFREDRVGKAGRVALGVSGQLKAFSIAGDRHGLDSAGCRCNLLRLDWREQRRRHQHAAAEKNRLFSDFKPL